MARCDLRCHRSGGDSACGGHDDGTGSGDKKARAHGAVYEPLPLAELDEMHAWTTTPPDDSQYEVLVVFRLNRAVARFGITVSRPCQRSMTAEASERA